MLIRRPTEIAALEITPRDVFLRRRELLAGSAAFGALAFAGFSARAAGLVGAKSAFSTDETQTRRADATTYNNFYEFGTD